MRVSRERRFTYWMDGMNLALVNPPESAGRNKRELAETAEAWRDYALRRWGPQVSDFEVRWGENGQVGFRMAMKEEIAR